MKNQIEILEDKIKEQDKVINAQYRALVKVLKMNGQDRDIPSTIDQLVGYYLDQPSDLYHAYQMLKSQFDTELEIAKREIKNPPKTRSAKQRLLDRLTSDVAQLNEQCKADYGGRYEFVAKPFKHSDRFSLVHLVLLDHDLDYAREEWTTYSRIGKRYIFVHIWDICNNFVLRQEEKKVTANDKTV